MIKKDYHCENVHLEVQGIAYNQTDINNLKLNKNKIKFYDFSSEQKNWTVSNIINYAEIYYISKEMISDVLIKINNS